MRKGTRKVRTRATTKQSRMLRRKRKRKTRKRKVRMMNQIRKKTKKRWKKTRRKRMITRKVEMEVKDLEEKSIFCFFIQSRTTGPST